MDNKKSLHIYVAVDTRKVSRCTWCGSIQSEDWLHRGNRLYCSSDCQSADQADMFVGGYFLIVFLVNMLVIITRQLYLSAFLLATVFSLVFFSPVLYWGLAGWNRKKSLPKDSRRNADISEVSLLKALSITVSCPKCDANLDVTRIGEDRIFHCEYCGASGTIDVAKER